MDGQTLQSILFNGYRIAAENVGYPFDIYRPTGPLSPIGPANQVLSAQPAAFTTHAAPYFSFGKPSDHKDALFHGMFDGSVIHVGDFLVSPTVGIYAVLSQEPVQPPLCVQCVRRLTFTRPSGEGQFGLGSYGGSTLDNQVVVMADWPASVIEQGNSRSLGGALPSDGGALRWDILLTAWPGVMLRVSDLIIDENGNRYIVTGAELSELGWRLKATQAVI